MDSGYRASKNRSQGREGWCVLFNHPLRRDNQGRILRVRRGLATRDESEADQLVEQLNQMLKDESYWGLSARERAARNFDPRVVSIFYDKIEGRVRDPWEIREEVIKIPTPAEGYSRILMVGATGAGKTTLLRQLLGTDPKRERFPSTSTAKTTIFDIEVVLREGEYEAVISFLSRDLVRFYLEECVTAAVSAAAEGKDNQEVLRKLLEHSEQRFRLSYLLGTLPLRGETEDFEEEFEDEDEGFSDDLSAEDKEVNAEERINLELKLKSYLDRTLALAGAIHKEVADQLGEKPETLTLEDRDAFLDLVEDNIRNNETAQSLIEDILQDIESKFALFEEGEYESDQTDWPIRWNLKTNERLTFIKMVNRFSSNYAPNFGRLLTPLVSGMRFSGPFRPIWTEDREAPKLVFIDGEGLGHTPDSALALPTSITKRYEVADVVLLVDSAQQPVQAAAQAVLRSLAVSGHNAKLALVFTHFDMVKGDNLPTTAAKKAHVLGSLDGVIEAIDKDIGSSIGKRLKRNLEGRIFFLGGIQEQLAERARFTRQEIARLLALLEAAAYPLEISTAIPIYDLGNLVICIRSATETFHSYWRAKLGFEYKPGVYSEHWARVKALSRRFAFQWADAYDNLRPVADLIKALSERLSAFISSPRDWQPQNTSEEIRQVAIERVAQEVFSRLHNLVSDRLFHDRLNEWGTAYERRGTGSARVRARDIQGIYEVGAPVPAEIPYPESAEFLDQIRKLFREAADAAGAKIIM